MAPRKESDLDACIGDVVFNEKGLVPVIAQRHDTAEILMLAWMNRESLEKTLDTGDAWYFSRSRQKLWRKGETSGNSQRVVAALLDCDGDTIILHVIQKGFACHTGQKNCFFRRLGKRNG